MKSSHNLLITLEQQGNRLPGMLFVVLQTCCKNPCLDQNGGCMMCDFSCIFSCVVVNAVVCFKSPSFAVSQNIKYSNMPS